MKVTRWARRVLYRHREQLPKLIEEVEVVPGTPIHQFPFEILNYIISFISNDQDDIESCTFVCRSFSNAARPFIFRDITLYNEDRFEDLLWMIRETNHLGGWIRKLRIDAREYRRLQQDWVFRAINFLYCHLTQLHVLELLGLFECPRFNQDGFFSRLSSISTITTLRILECGLPHSILQSFASTFPQLTSLSVQRTRTSFYEEHHPVGFFSPRLTSLGIYDEYGEIEGPFIEWITSAGLSKALRHLEIDVTRSRNVLKTQTLINKAGPQLEHLVLGRFITDGLREAPVSLINCTALHHLGFLGSLNRAVVNSISRLPSPETLRTLTLGISDRKVWERYNGRYKLLDEYLGRIEYLNLKEVLFLCSSVHWNAGNWTGKILAAFPRLAERKLIQVSVV